MRPSCDPLRPAAAVPRRRGRSASLERQPPPCPALACLQGGDAYHPSSAELLAERGVLPGGGVRRRGGGGGGINRRKQGGDDYLAQVGALAVPEHARARARQERAGGARGALAQARGVLALTAVPRSLPCREGERQQIADFVAEVLKEGERPCCLLPLLPAAVFARGPSRVCLHLMR